MKAANIWQSLPQPFFILAPMDDVTNDIFRRVITRAAAPDLFITEFASADGFQSAGRLSVQRKLYLDPAETIPVIAQLWGTDPQNYEKTARQLREIGFTGIDINMGCPVREIVARGCCSALIKTPSKAADIIAATKEGAGDLPVSVKTRTGFHDVVTEEWLAFLLDQRLDALTVHGRTAKQQSAVPADWNEIGKAVALRDQLSPHTKIIGNGDVNTVAEGQERVSAYKLDGIMIGRGIFTNPYLFRGDAAPARHELFELLDYHLSLHEARNGDTARFEPLKKFFKIYIRDFDGASDFRQLLMETHSVSEARAVLAQQALTKA